MFRFKPYNAEVTVYFKLYKSVNSYRLKRHMATMSKKALMFLVDIFLLQFYLDL